jgi:uncharacterized protein YndB with AHSA1/START domain
MTDLRTINVDQFVPCAPAVVWRALTEPSLMERWWAPSDIAPVVGRAFTITFPDWGVQQCTVTAVEQPHTLCYTFAEGVLDSTITWFLSPEGAGTQLFLAHGGLDVGSPVGATAFKGMAAGWPGVLAHLTKVLAAGIDG